MFWIAGLIFFVGAFIRALLTDADTWQVVITGAWTLIAAVWLARIYLARRSKAAGLSHPDERRR